MAQYLQKRKSGGYLYRRRVPKDLRHRTDTFPNSHIEEYLSTSDKAVAKREVSAANEAWERTFDAMRKDETITADQMERIRLVAQYQVHGAMMADPLGGPKAIADAIDAFLPNVEADARKYLERAGLDPSERNMDAATRAILIGTVGAQALYDRGLTPPELPFYEPLTLDAAPDGPTILEAAQAYQDAADVSTSPKTRKQHLSSARLFADHVGKAKPVAAVTGRDAVAFLDRLARIDPAYRRDPRAGKMTLAEIEADYPAAAAGDGLAAATLNRHATHLRVLINWLIRRHELPEEHRNPFAGKSRKAKPRVTRRAMTDSEIAALLDGAPLARSFGRNFKECCGWLVMLGAYTGAREGGLCTLTVDDVREKDGIPFVAIRESKTDNAPRVVPLHPELIKAGFLDYVAKCQGPLFGVTAKTVAKRFPAYRRSRGVDSPGVVFHSLRNSFIARLEDAEVSADTAAMLVGHKSKRSFTYDVYNPTGPTLRKLSEAVAKVRYVGLTGTTHKAL